MNSKKQNACRPQISMKIFFDIRHECVQLIFKIQLEKNVQKQKLKTVKRKSKDKKLNRKGGANVAGRKCNINFLTLSSKFCH